MSEPMGRRHLHLPQSVGRAPWRDDDGARPEALRPDGSPRVPHRVMAVALPVRLRLLDLPRGPAPWLSLTCRGGGFSLRSVCANSSLLVVGSFPAAEASFFAVDRPVAAARNFFVVATGADFFSDRAGATGVGFFAFDRLDFDSLVSSLISFFTNSGFFRSAVPLTPRPCSLRRSSPTFIRAIALSLTSGVFGVSLPLVGFFLLLMAATPIHLIFRSLVSYLKGLTQRFPNHTDGGERGTHTVAARRSHG